MLAPRHPRATIPGLLADSIRSHAAADAILRLDQPALTYAELGATLDAIVAKLADTGFGHGTRIGIALPDGPELAIAILGVCSAATCVPLDDELDEQALQRLLVAMRIDALIVPEGSNSAPARAARQVAVGLIALRRSPQNRGVILDLIPESTRPRVPVEASQPDDIALLIHTSGTTGAPKIVPWEQWRVAEVVRARVELLPTDASDRCLVALPLHTSAGVRRMLSGLLQGGSIICAGVLTADATIELLESLAPTHYFAPPASHMALLEAFERRVPRPHHCLKVLWSGTADLPDPLRSRLEQAFSIPVLVGYGTTESGLIAHVPLPPARAPAGSVGRAVNCEIAITDNAGSPLGPDELGEVVVRGPEVFAGYENDDESNRTAFRNGWFRTGDMGRIDRDGFLYLSGRLKDVINRGGMKVAPGEVEAALAQHPQVIEAAAFAVSHPTLGEDLAAAVVLRDRVSESELRGFLRGRLPMFKIPTRITDVAELPRGSSGKVNRTELAALAAATVGAKNEEAPLGREEIEIARIFLDVLKAPSVGRQSNFFDLGGDSLRAMHVLAAVDAALGVSVTLEVLFDHPTVSEFAAAVGDAARAHTGQPAPLASARTLRSA